MYGEAAGSVALTMPGPLVRVRPQGIVGHVPEAEPRGKRQANAPRHGHGPEDPVGHAEHQADVLGVAVVAPEVAGRDAPDQGRRPDGHDEQALAAGVAQQLLLFGGGRLWWFHRYAPRIGPPSS